MDLGLQDKVCVVTGASRGIGLATAQRLCAEGARVLFVARDAEARDGLRAAAPQRLAVELDRAAPPNGAGDGAQRRRLPGAVGAEQGDHLPLLHGQRHPVQGLDRSVPRVHVAECEQGRHRRPYPTSDLTDESILSQR